MQKIIRYIAIDYDRDDLFLRKEKFPTEKYIDCNSEVKTHITNSYVYKIRFTYFSSFS